MKLTKTEEKILEVIDNLPGNGCYHALWSYGQTRNGGKVNYGKREYNACKKLIERGLVEDVTPEPRSNSVFSNGYRLNGLNIVVRRPE